MNIEENIKQRIGWLEKRMGFTNNERELIIFQMKELAQQLTLTDVVVPKGTCCLNPQRISHVTVDGITHSTCENCKEEIV